MILKIIFYGILMGAWCNIFYQFKKAKKHIDDSIAEVKQEKEDLNNVDEF